MILIDLSVQHGSGVRGGWGWVVGGGVSREVDAVPPRTLPRCESYTTCTVAG